MEKDFRILFVLALVFLIPTVSYAVPVRWTLSDFTFNGGGTATGSFVYDASVGLNGEYSQVSVVTSGGGTFDETYDMAGSVATNFTVNLFRSSDGPDFTGDHKMDLFFIDNGMLTDAGGVVPLGFAGLLGSIGTCSNPICDSIVPPFASQLSSGTVIGTPIPEPSSVALLGAGIAGLLWLRRKNLP